MHPGFRPGALWRGSWVLRVFVAENEQFTRQQRPAGTRDQCRAPLNRRVSLSAPVPVRTAFHTITPGPWTPLSPHINRHSVSEYDKYIYRTYISLAVTELDTITPHDQYNSITSCLCIGVKNNRDCSLRGSGDVIPLTYNCYSTLPIDRKSPRLMASRAHQPQFTAGCVIVGQIWDNNHGPVYVEWSTDRWVKNRKHGLLPSR